MRKLFWGSVVGGVAVAAGAFSTAHFAVRHPDSLVGQLLFGAGRAVAVMNPHSALAPTLARLDQTCCPAAGGEEPAEVSEPAELVFAPEPAAAAPIVIPEDGPVPAAPIPVMPDNLCPVRYTEVFPPAAPAVMPRCEEEGDTSERIGVEQLRMPTPAEGGEEQEADDGHGGSADKILRMFHKMLKHVGEQPRPGKAAPAKPRGLFHTQPHEFFPAARNVDTMEFRATDRSLSDYGFGPL